MVFQCINIRQVPLEVLKTAAFGIGFQHLPRDLANVNALKNHIWSLYEQTNVKLPKEGHLHIAQHSKGKAFAFWHSMKCQN